MLRQAIISRIPRGAFLTKAPVLSFFFLVALLFGSIMASHALRNEKISDAVSLTQEKKTVSFFSPNKDVAFMTVPAQVRKTSVVNIVALTSGIVSSLSVTPGKNVAAGQTLLKITTDYESDATHLKKELANNQAELAKKTTSLNKRIFSLEEKRIRQNDTLTDTEKKLALEQITKNRAENKTTLKQSVLEQSLAYQNDAVLTPKTFVSGTVERLAVREGDFVLPGDILITIHAPAQTATLETLVSRKVALLVDVTKSARLTIGSDTIELLPSYFSRQETKDNLYSLLFVLSETTKNRIGDGEFLQLEIPLRPTNTDSFLVPIDAIFQTGNKTTVFVEENGTAISKQVTAGNIYGEFVEILSGISSDTRIITDRSVLSGDILITP
ncbi:MAG: biotin/lipoyl-binding protein [Candidatus Moranbacteria bacterium]|nr:biotin/lipoyl-binding protein [Candidatus Moranbacteria bacterium]